MSMEARLIHLSIALSVVFSMGATYRTPNFVVDAPTQEIAVQAGKTAEKYRVLLAKAWLNQELPTWSKPCKLKVKVGQIGAGGATTFQFHKGHVYGWDMRVQGTLERVLDSVIPHEVSHTIFATYFRRPLPRWADEGAATLIEHESERRKQHMILKQVFHTSKRIPLKTLLVLKEYPQARQDVYTLYAEGYSLADFLVKAGGKKRFLQFLETAHHHGWTSSLRKHYSLETVDDLEKRWNDWIIAGSPDIERDSDIQLADASADQKSATSRIKLSRKKGVVVRSQNPEQKSAPESESSADAENVKAPAPPVHAKNTLKQNLAYTLASQKRWQLKSHTSQNNQENSGASLQLPLSSSQSSEHSETRSSSRIEKYENGLQLMKVDDTINKDSNSGVFDFSSYHVSPWTDFPQRQQEHGAAKLGNQSTGNSSS